MTAHAALICGWTGPQSLIATLENPPSARRYGSGLSKGCGRTTIFSFGYAAARRVPISIIPLMDSSSASVIFRIAS